MNRALDAAIIDLDSAMIGTVADFEVALTRRRAAAKALDAISDRLEPIATRPSR